MSRESPSVPGTAPNWSADGIAGVSVALVLIPQSMAYAELAGMPPWHGLYAAAAAPVLAAPFVSSRYLQTGPVALTCLLTAGALAGMAPAGSTEYVGLAAVLALVVAVVRLLIGLVRWGGVAWLMSEPVLRGFTLGAAFLIFCSQLPAALGVSAGVGGTVVSRAGSAVAAPGTWVGGAVALSVVTVVLMRGGKRIHALFPGVLVAAALGLGASVAGLPIGATIGDVPSGLPPLKLDLPWSSLGALLVPGVVIALVGFGEAASISRTFAADDRERWDPDREFISQGVANLAAGLWSGFPVGGSFSRSSLARLAGARTRWAGAVTGVVVLAALPVAGLLSPLPRAILGATVVGAVLGLLDPRPLLSIWRTSRPQAAIGVATLVATVAFAPHVEYGVVVGVGLSVVVHLWRETTVHVPVEVDSLTLRVRPAGVLWFGTAATLEQGVLDALAAHPDAEHLVIDLSGLGRIDFSGALVLARTVKEVREDGVLVILEGAPPQARGLLERVGAEWAEEERP